MANGVPFVQWRGDFDRYLAEKCQSTNDDGFHECGLFRGHNGDHVCAAAVCREPWDDEHADGAVSTPDRGSPNGLQRET